MATERYFEKFPQITYSNNVVVDITKRVTLLDRVSSNPYIFYPYEITANERADQFSSRYYKDPYSSWMLYIANKITDPYYEWYLSNDEFNEFIIKKYGSIVTAQQKIKYYRNNWISSIEQDITPSRFNSLTVSQQDFWEPEFDNNNRAKFYKRKQKDWNFVTNKIVRFLVSEPEYKISSLIKDEIVNIVYNGKQSGYGQVLKITILGGGGFVFLQHIRGPYEDHNPFGLEGNNNLYCEESGMTLYYNGATTICDNIPAELNTYYEPVSYYDYENEKNEYNKTIRVMDSDLRETMATNLKDLMKENF